MARTILSGKNDQDQRVEVTRTEGSYALQALTGGIAGQATYCVKVDNKVQVSTSSKDEAINSASNKLNK